MEIERKGSGKKIKVFLSWIFLELKLRFLRKFKIRGFYSLGSYPLVGRHVEWEIQSHGVILKDKVKIGIGNKNDCLLRKKNDEKEELKVFFRSGFVLYTRWGAMLWTMAKIWS